MRTRRLFASRAWRAAERILARPELRILVAADFDGTLAPIAPRPRLVRVPAEIRQLLARGAQLPRVRVAIVSARPMRDLRKHLRAPGLLRVAQYGLEGVGAPEPARRRRLRSGARALRALLTPIVGSHAGAWIEDKGLTLGVHFRALSAAECGRLLAELRPARDAARRLGFAMEGGRRVVDFVPSRYDKGRALKALVRRTRPAATFYFGDSAGDESAFAVLGGSDFAVRVGPGPTAASYRVDGRQDVARFLRALVRRRGARTKP